MIISNKLVKYLHTVIHHTFFNTTYNNDIQKQNVKTNLFNILKGNSNSEFIIKICTCEFEKIINYEVNYYFKHKHCEIETNPNYTNLLFEHFLDLYKKSITLTNLFSELYKFSELDIITEDYKLNKLLIKSWDSIVFNNIFYKIIKTINNNIYSKKTSIDLENIVYVIKSQFKNRFIQLTSEIKTYSSKFYIINRNPLEDTLHSYITKYKEFNINEVRLENLYTFYNYIDFKDELVILFFRTNLDYVIDLFNKTLEEENLDNIKYANQFLYNYTDNENFITLVEKVIIFLKKKYEDCDILEQYIKVYNRIKSIYHIDIFINNIEPLLDLKFEDIKVIPNIEKKLIKRIIEDIKQHKLSDYIKLIRFVDEYIFISHYINNLCKRIINNKIDINVELKYYSAFKNLEMDLYKIELILSDVSINKSINNELFFCKTELLTGRYMIWPLKKKEKIVLPKSFNNERNLLDCWYNDKFPTRKLHFIPTLLRCEIQFNDYKFNIKGIYSDILLKFNDTDSIKQDSIVQNIDPFIKIKLIIKKNDEYHINDNFYSEKKYIKLN